MGALDDLLSGQSEQINKPGALDALLASNNPKSLSDYSLSDAWKIAKGAFKQTPIYNTLTQGIPGAVEGATAGLVKPGETPQDEAGQWARNTGKFIGAALPASAAYKAGQVIGAPLVATGAKYAPGIIGGLLYGGLEGVTQQLPPSETARRMSIYGSIPPIVEGVGIPTIKATGKFLGETAPEKLANWYLNTPTKIAKKYVEQNVPDQVISATEFHPEVKIPGEQQSLGKEFLNEPGRPAVQSQQETYDWAKGKLNSTENVIESQLQNLKDNAVKTDVYGKGVLGEPVNIGSKISPGININEIANKRVVDNVIDKLLPIMEKNEPDISKIQLLKNIKNNETGYLNVQDANDFRRILDAEVSSDYLKPSGDRTWPSGAMSYLADSIRGNMAKQFPELADNLSSEHRMLNYMTSLKPEIAQTGFGKGPSGIFKTLVKETAESRGSIGLANFLSKFKGVK